MNENSVSEMFNLKGKVSIVTGGSEWLGYDMACALAEFGSDIIITSRTLDRAEDALGKIKTEYGVDTLALTMDQCNHDEVQAMAEKAKAWKGHIDILINNAGGGSGKSTGYLLKRSPDDIIQMISTNLVGSLFCCQEVGRHMVEQGRGKIINIASAGGLVGRDRRIYERNNKEQQPIDYAAAKSGVIGMTMDLAGLLTPMGVHVNAISPGGFDKGDLPDGFVKDFGDMTMHGRMGRMGVDLKGAALFLASSASDYVSGHNLVVDGGFSIFK